MGAAVSAILTIALVWIFWPILLPTIMILNSIAFLPFNILFTFISTIGESVLFAISLGCVGLYIKDNFYVQHSDQSFPPEAEEAFEEDELAEETPQSHEINSSEGESGALEAEEAIEEDSTEASSEENLVNEEESADSNLQDHSEKPNMAKFEGEHLEDEATKSPFDEIIETELPAKEVLPDLAKEVIEDFKQEKAAMQEVEMPAAPSAC